MTPLAPRLPFALLFALRTHLGSNRFLAALTILAVAMSVALATGLEMSSRSVEAELERTADELAGAAQLQVSAGELGLPEALLPRVASVPGVRVAAPMLHQTFRVAEPGASDRAVQVIGVDFLADPEVRTYAVSGQAAQVPDPLRLLARVDAVLLSAAFASQLELAPGDRLRVRDGRTEHVLIVQGLLGPEGLAEAFGGQIAVMDVWALQTLLGRTGWVDRIDVVLERGADADTVAQALRREVGGTASVRPSAARDIWVDNTLATMRLIVWSLVVVAIGVASLLAYGAISLFVDRRMRELALLRAAGLESGRVRRLLYVDTGVLAAIGTVLGFGLGLVLSRGFVTVLGRIPAFFQDVQIERLEPSAATLGIGVLVGVVVAFAGALEPTRRAVARPPLEVLGAARGSPRAAPRTRFPIAAVLAAAWLVVWLAPLSLPPFVRLAAILALGLALLGRFASAPLATGLRRLHPVFERILPGIGRLAGTMLVARPANTAITVAALGGALTGITASGVLVASLTRTLDAWTANLYPGGALVTAGSTFALNPEEPIRHETIATIRATPGVRAVFEHVSATILHQGEEVLLAGSNMDVMAEHGRLPVIGDDPTDVARAIARGAIAVSDRFAHHFGVGVNDTIVLDTPRGPRSFPVAGILRDYAGPTGSLNLDLRLFDELWPRDGARDLVIWADGPLEPVIDEIRRRVGTEQALFFALGDDLERFASRLLERFLRLFDVVAALTALLGGIAVMVLLLGAVVERRRELALLRSTGATRRQVAALVLVDGTLIGLVGGIGGIALGIVCAFPVVSRIVPDALGWSLVFSVDPVQTLLLVGSVGLASLAASLYPAWETRRIVPREVFAPE